MKKGISLITLIIYIVALTAIIGVIVVFNVNVLSNANNFVAVSKLYEQYIDYNMFLLSLLSNQNLTSVDITNSLDNVTLYLYSDDTVIGRMLYNQETKRIIYTDGANKTFPIAEFVDGVSYSLETADNGKNTVIVDLDFKLKDVTYSPTIEVEYVVGGAY